MQNIHSTYVVSDVNQCLIGISDGVVCEGKSLKVGRLGQRAQVVEIIVVEDQDAQACEFLKGRHRTIKDKYTRVKVGEMTI